VQPQYLPSPSFPSTPPPSRQASELAHMQVCGPGSLLSQQSGSSDGDQPAERAVGVSLASAHSSLRVAPDHKRLGGDEHTSTACTEFSSIPRDLAAEAQTGCLIVHCGGATLFALHSALTPFADAISAVQHSESQVQARGTAILAARASAVATPPAAPRRLASSPAA